MSSNSGRTLMVTGASAGIGMVTALEAAKQGWRISIGARRPDRIAQTADELRKIGAEVFAGALDVSNAESVEAFFGASEAALGPADAIVNNAGHSQPYRMHEYPPEQLASEVGTNILGAMFVTRRALQPLLAAGLRGDVVFMSSDSVRNPRPGQLAYGAAKAALENLADGLAKELECTGIRVLKVRIGPTYSEFGFGWEAERAMQAIELWQRFSLRDARLSGVMLPPESVAHAVLYAINQPPEVLIDTIEIQPGAPQGGVVPTPPSSDEDSPLWQPRVRPTDG